ncbi:MAG: peptidase S8, partial [Burkholderiales bacterium]|nr:peptidase S8 [Burkholderiales bacterium]
GAGAGTLDSALFDSAQDLGASGWDEEYGYGRVNASAAVNAVRQAPTVDTQVPWVEIVSPTGGAVSGVVPVDVDAGDNVSVVKVELYANGALVATDTDTPYGFSLDTSVYSNETVTLEAVAEDAAGNSASSGFVTVTVGDVSGGSGGTNDGSSDTSSDVIPPTVSITSPGEGDTVSGTVTISVSADDDVEVARIVLLIDGSEVDVAYGPSLTYEWT